MGKGLQAQAEEEIRVIAEGVKNHPALNNNFYKLWMSRKLSGDQVALFARNFYERVSKTPDRIALAFLHMTDTGARAETVENLYDEMGKGNPDQAHLVVLRGFFETLLSKIYRRQIRFDDLAAPVLGSTRALLTQAEVLFSSPRPPTVCGALLAQEWHAYTQLVYIYEGVRNYMELYDQEEFHDSCEYFYLHIGAAEKEHKIHAISTAAQMCHTDRDLELLKGGFDGYLALLSANWEEIYAKMEACATAKG